MTNNPPAYGFWTRVIINSAIFLIFAFSFTKPETTRDWRSFSAFSGFIVALVVMYVRLATHEETEARATFGETWKRYATRTPRFLPRVGRGTVSWSSVDSQRPV